MWKKCFKCGYERGKSDIAPKYECPKCGAIYAKVEAAIKRKDTNTFASIEKRTGASLDHDIGSPRPRRWLLVLLAALIVVWVVVTKPFAPTILKPPVEISVNYTLSLTLQKYLKRNFAVSGFVTSWYQNILFVKVIGNTVVVETDLTRGNSKLTDICGALSGFIYANDKRSFNISKIRVVSTYGATLLRRESRSGRCNLL